MKKRIVVLGATFVAALGVSHDARAQCCPTAALPSNGSCTLTGNCFEVSNTTSSGSAIYGHSPFTTGTQYGVQGDNASASGFGVYGTNSNGGTGVVGESTSNLGSGSSIGVQGVSAATSGAGYGVVGISDTPSGSGVVGANGTTAAGSGLDGAGVFGITAVSGASAVFGEAAAGVFANGVAGVSSSSNASGVYGSNTSGGIGVYGTNADSNTSGYAGYFNGRVSIVGNLVLGGSCTGTTCSSDIRLKKNVESLSGSLDDLAKLRPVTFEWKNPEERGYSAGKQFGFIAQEVEKVKPEWVGVDDQGFKTINTTSLPVLLVDSVRTLKTENDVLRARTAALEDRVRSLEANRRPMISGVGEGGIGFGLLAVAGAVLISRRRRPEWAA